MPLALPPFLALHRLARCRLTQSIVQEQQQCERQASHLLVTERPERLTAHNRTQPTLQLDAAPPSNAFACLNSVGVPSSLLSIVFVQHRKPMQVKCFVFDDAKETFWKEDVGSIFALLNARVLPSSERGTAISVSKASQVCRLVSCISQRRRVCLCAVRRRTVTYPGLL